MKRINLGPQENQFVLNSGRKIFLEKLFQYETYWGLLLGVPDKSMNDEIMEYSMRQAKSKKQKIEPFLIKPENKRYKIE